VVQRHRRARPLVAQRLDSDRRERVRRLHELEVFHVALLGNRPLVQDDAVRDVAREAAVGGHLGCGLPDRLADLLELRSRLASSRDRHQLRRALAEFAAPRQIQIHVLLPVRLIDHRKRRNHAVAASRVRRENLDHRLMLSVLDPAIAVLTLKAGELRTHDEPLRLPVEQHCLIARGRSNRHRREANYLRVPEQERSEERRLSVALGDDEPTLGMSRRHVIHERQLKRLELEQFSRIQNEARGELREGRKVRHGGTPRRGVEVRDRPSVARYQRYSHHTEGREPSRSYDSGQCIDGHREARTPCRR
jgi:hypothetical protein